MTYLIVGDWHKDDFYPTAINEVAEESDAIAIVEKIKAGNSPNAFYTEMPPQGPHAKFMRVDPVAKTVSFDQSAKDAEELALNIQEVQMNRRQAYQAEADSLYFEEQAGEVAAGTWAAKRSEIKERFPK
jgi:hypothetical protein